MFIIFMRGIRVRSYCIYHMHGVEFFRDNFLRSCDVSFCRVVIDATLLSER